MVVIGFNKEGNPTGGHWWTCAGGCGKTWFHEGPWIILPECLKCYVSNNPIRRR